MPLGLHHRLLGRHFFKYEFFLPLDCLKVESQHTQLMFALAVSVVVLDLNESDVALVGIALKGYLDIAELFSFSFEPVEEGQFVDEDLGILLRFLNDGDQIEFNHLLAPEGIDVGVGCAVGERHLEEVVPAREGVEIGGTILEGSIQSLIYLAIHTN